jgi:hypothetical protein
MRPLGWFLTFASVVMAMAFFRAKTVAAATSLVAGMVGLHGASIPQAILNRAGCIGGLLTSLGVGGDSSSGNIFMFACLWLGVLFIIVLCLPNSLEIWRQHSPALYFDPNPVDAASVDSRPPRLWVQANFNQSWAFACAVFLVFGILGLNRVSEFLYWQF